ncbi:MAG: hypothetical protein EXR62_09115 [Chloroflexi bacterium]|nr:hypothetical protein [Chloroflexota bacterium]
MFTKPGNRASLLLALLPGLLAAVVELLALFLAGWLPEQPLPIRAGLVECPYFDEKLVDHAQLVLNERLLALGSAGRPALPLSQGLPGLLDRCPAKPAGVVLLRDITDPIWPRRAAQAGIKWVRLYTEWHDVQPDREYSRGPSAGASLTRTTSFGTIYNWRYLDRDIATAEGAGLTPVVTIQGAPEWAASTPCGPLYPQYIPEFARFVAALAQRYDGDGVADMPGLRWPVRYLELWNEPDNTDLAAVSLGGCWGDDVNLNGKADSLEYADMLRQVYPAVKAISPQTQIMPGGLSLDVFETGSVIGYPSYSGPKFSADFLPALLRTGAGNYFDVVSFHHYDGYRIYWDQVYGARPEAQNLMAKARGVRQILAGYGYVKPLASTEVGLQVSSSSPELQASHLVQEMVQAYAAGLIFATWFNMRDQPDDLPWGLFDKAGTPRPAYAALGWITGELQNYRFVRQVVTPIPQVQAYLFQEISGSSRQNGLGRQNNGDHQKLVLWWDSGFPKNRLQAAGTAAEGIQVSLSPQDLHLAGQYYNLHYREGNLTPSASQISATEATTFRLSADPVVVEIW